MKHLIAKEHYPHLKKRAILETLGFFALLFVVVNEWEVIDKALFSIRNSDLLYLSMALGLYWLSLPLTAISYSLLCDKKIPLVSTTLAQIAGSGPGRIIPGGLGHISVSVVHLKKLGIKVQKAIVVTIANNVLSVALNGLILLGVLVYKPEIRTAITERISAEILGITTILAIAAISLFQWLMHVRKIRNSVNKVNLQWQYLFKHLRKHPKRILGLVLIAFTTIVINVLLIMLAGDALQTTLNPFDALISLSIGVLIGGIIPTPGGLGGVEAGITGTLVLLGYGATEATSVALLFRTVTYWQPLLPGTLAYFYLRERKLL